jgi:arginyl-tRNA synthetase
MIWDFLNEKLAEAFAAAGYCDVPAVAEKSRRPEAGQFQCNTAMSLAKAARQAPVAIANAVAAKLEFPLDRVSVAGPGSSTSRSPTSTWRAGPGRCSAIRGTARRGCSPSS